MLRAVPLLAPHLFEHVDPVFTHDFAHHAFAVAAFEQRFSEVGELTHGADAKRVDDLAEAGQAAGVTLVMGEHFEEILAMANKLARSKLSKGKALTSPLKQAPDLVDEAQ